MRAALALLLVAGCVDQPAPDVGRAFYGENCAACHGASARGDGPLAVGLARRPADLTTIARRNGRFDRDAVMSTIDGYYRRVDPAHPMPAFGEDLEGQIVMVENPDGTVTPTPELLLALADYLERLQR